MMMQILPVSNSAELNNDFKQIYLESFPPEERREWQDQIKLLDLPYFIMNQVLVNQEIIGLISIWNLPGFVFIEHFAIRHSFRGKGFGSLVLKHIIEERTNRIVVEVEMPETELAKRRIAFYSRLGFNKIDGIYYQPPYSPNKNKIKMLLMSFPEIQNSDDFEEIKAQIYEHVYHQKEVYN